MATQTTGVTTDSFINIQRGSATLSDGSTVSLHGNPISNAVQTLSILKTSGSTRDARTFAAAGTFSTTISMSTDLAVCSLSMTLDSTDNMHIVYMVRNSNSITPGGGARLRLFYTYIPYASGTWSGAATTTELTSQAGMSTQDAYPHRCDIETTNAGVPVIAYSFEVPVNAGNGTLNSSYSVPFHRLLVRRTSDNTWVLSDIFNGNEDNTQCATYNTSYKGYPLSISIAKDSRDVGYLSASSCAFMVACATGGVATGASTFSIGSNKVYAILVNISTGARLYRTANIITGAGTSAYVYQVEFMLFSMDNGKILVSQTLTYFSGTNSKVCTGGSQIILTATVFFLGIFFDLRDVARLKYYDNSNQVNISNVWHSGDLVSSLGVEVVGRPRPGTNGLTSDWTVGYFFWTLTNDSAVTYTDMTMQNYFIRFPAEVLNASTTNQIYNAGPFGNVGKSNTVEKNHWVRNPPAFNRTATAPYCDAAGWPIRSGGNKNNSRADSRCEIFATMPIDAVTPNATYRLFYQSNVELPAVPTLGPESSAAAANYALIVPNGSTVNDNKFNPSVQIRDKRYGQQSGMQSRWQFATDSGFTTNVKWLAYPQSYDVNNPNSNQFSLTPIVSDPAGRYYFYTYGTINYSDGFFQSTWYVRGTFIDGYFVDLNRFIGTTTSSTAYAGYNSFVITHVPTCITLSPTVSNYLSTPAGNQLSISFQYGDTSQDSTMTAYQAQVLLPDGSTLFDSGKITKTSAAVGATGVTVSDILAAGSAPNTAKDITLTWKVRAYDQDNLVGPYSTPQQFIFGDPPTLSNFSPAANALVNNPSPTVGWTFTSGDAAGNRKQKQYQVTWFDSGGNALYTTGIVSAVTYTATPPTALYTNGQSGSYQITVIDNQNLTRTSSLVPFSISYTSSAAVPTQQVDTTWYETLGYNNITWSIPARDVSFYSTRLYRQDTDQYGNYSAPVFLYESTSNSISYAFKDYMAPSSVSCKYFVTQLATRFGINIESGYVSSTVTPVSGDYWLIGADIYTNANAILLRLVNVTSDSYEDEYESTTLNLIGRGRKVDYGTHYGVKGTLTVNLYDIFNGLTARQQKQRLETVKLNRVTMWLRTPFGDLYLVNIENLSVSRIAGVGQREFVTVSLPYSQVS